MPIDPSSDRAIYHQIADQLRARIRAGTYQPDEQLPAEPALADEFGVARLTVRRGLAVLQNEGLIEVRRGRGFFVPLPPPVLTMRSTRFSRAARRGGKGALAAEAEAQGLRWHSESSGVDLIDLPPAIANALGEPRGAVRHRRMWINDVPTQLADSYIPATLDTEIGWSTGSTAPGGIYGLLEQHGHVIARYREELYARPAAPEESLALHLPVGAPVVSLIRHAITDTGRVIEYFDSVAAADKHRYVYEFDAPDD